MIEICAGLFIGSEYDYESKVCRETGWKVVHACKEPYHRQLLGYKGRGAPKEHPEYFFAERGSRLFLNIVDADDPAYIPKQIMDKALDFIDAALKTGGRILVHCNQGESRAPAIGLLYLASRTKAIQAATATQYEDAFRKLYPMYNPKGGMRGFIHSHWGEYVKA